MGSFETCLATYVYPFQYQKYYFKSDNISSSPINHYKKTAVAIPPLDSLIIQMQSIFDKDRHARHLLFLVPSIIVNKALQLDDEVEGMLFWEKDILLPKSLGNEVSRWTTLWQSTDRELPNDLLLA